VGTALSPMAKMNEQTTFATSKIDNTYVQGAREETVRTRNRDHHQLAFSLWSSLFWIVPVMWDHRPWSLLWLHGITSRFVPTFLMAKSYSIICVHHNLFLQSSGSDVVLFQLL
jgi:hypothetical protein